MDRVPTDPWRLNPWGGPEEDPEIAPDDGGRTERLANASTVEEVRAIAAEYDDEVAKRLSSNFASSSARRAQLVSRLKRRRRYPSPTRGGTGKQARTRRPKF